MAASGIIFIGFVLLHMYGNLKAFSGHDAYNEYAEHLRILGEPMVPREGALWMIRTVLIVSLVVHVAAAAALWKRARRARRTPYVMKKNHASSFSSRTHALGRADAPALHHLAPASTSRSARSTSQGGATNDPYNLLVDTFDTWWMTLIYLVAMLTLGMHLHHGVWSSAQTLGLTNNARARRNAKTLGWIVAVVIAGGFSLVPIFVLAGVITK